MPRQAASPTTTIDVELDARRGERVVHLRLEEQVRGEEAHPDRDHGDGEQRHGALQRDHPAQDPQPARRLSRSRLNGRLRSLRPPTTLTARLQPAMREAGDDDDVGQLLPAAQRVGEVRLEVAGHVRGHPEAVG